MSAGPFEIYNYKSELGTVHPIRLQPETVALTLDGNANSQSSDEIDSPFSVCVSRGANACGLLPRKVNIKFTGAAPAGYKADQTYSIPVLVATLWQNAVVNQTGTYLGEAIKVIGKSPEDIQ